MVCFFCRGILGSPIRYWTQATAVKAQNANHYATREFSQHCFLCTLLYYKTMTNTSISSVQLLSCVWLFATLWTVACQASLTFTNFWSLLKLMSVESVMLSNHLKILLSPSPAFNLSQHQGLFQWVGSWLQVAEVLELQLQHPSFQWVFRIDFF